MMLFIDLFCSAIHEAMKQLQKNKYLVSISVLVLSILLITVFGFKSSAGNEGENYSQEIPELVPLVNVVQQDVEANLEYVSSIEAVQNVEIRARVEGYLEETYVDEGMQVKKGQLLFRINQEEYQAELQKAVARRKSAEAETRASEVEVERVKLLVDKNVVSKTELQVAQAKLEVVRSQIEQAKAEESAARVKLSHCEVRSPFNGRIDRIPHRLGSLISEGTLLTTISDMEAVFAYFRVSELEYLEYFKSNKDSIFEESVQLILADDSVYPIEGEIETMSGEFEEGTGNIALRARFKNTNHLLKHGSTGKVRIKERMKNAMVIPQTAVLEIQDKNYVFSVDPNNTVYMKSFVAQARHGDIYIVRNGLNLGDRIVAEGVQNLREGSVIRPK